MEERTGTRGAERAGGFVVFVSTGADRTLKRGDEERHGDEGLRHDNRDGGEADFDADHRQVLAEQATPPPGEQQRQASHHRRQHHRQGDDCAQQPRPPHIRQIRQDECEGNAQTHAQRDRYSARFQ